MAMIDWVTVLVRCYHPEPLNGGRVIKIKPSGELEWETKTRLQIKGSHENTLQVLTERVDSNGHGTHLLLHGNPVKWLQGHNLFGSDDLIGLVAETMEQLSINLPTTPTNIDCASWWKGQFELTRVDATDSFECESRLAVRSWLRSMDYSAYMRRRGRGELTKNGTLYFGKHSRRWTLKCYAKGDEIEAKGHELKPGVALPEMIAWADNKLRVEVVMRSQELKRCGLRIGRNWDNNTASSLVREKLRNLEISDMHTLSPKILEGLSPRLQLAYDAWRHGKDLRELLPKKTFYRYRKQLQEHGIDIAVKQPKELHKDVVPIMHVVVAKPVGIPNWAYGTPLLFKPRKKTSTS